MLTYIAIEIRENTGIVGGGVGPSRLTYRHKSGKSEEIWGEKLEYSVPQTMALALPLDSQLVGYGRG